MSLQKGRFPIRAKRCPFCGRTPKIDLSALGYRVRCANTMGCALSVSTLVFNNRHGAVTAWNKRWGLGVSDRG